MSLLVNPFVSFPPAASSGAATFINSDSYTLVSATPAEQVIAVPLDVQAGDLCVIWVAIEATGLNASVSGGSGGWTRDPVTLLSFRYAAVWKVLTAGDISGTLTLYNINSNSTITVAFYRGVSSLSVKTPAESSTSSSTLSITGFTKSGSSKLILGLVADRDTASIPAWPVNWTQRVIDSNAVSATFMCEIRDIDPSLYTSNSAVNLTNFVTGTRQIGVLCELT